MQNQSVCFQCQIIFCYQASTGRPQGIDEEEVEAFLSTSVDIGEIRSFDPVISTTVLGRELRLGQSDTKKTVFLCTISNLLYYEWFHTIEVTLNL